MSDLIWKDPPLASKRSRGRWKNIAEILKENPNKWALVEKSLTVKAASAAQQALRKHGCESRSVPLTNEEGLRTGYWELYARYSVTEEDDY